MADVAAHVCKIRPPRCSRDRSPNEP